MCKIEPIHFHLNQNPYHRLLSDFNGNDKMVDVDLNILCQLNVAADLLQHAFKWHDFVFCMLLNTVNCEGGCFYVGTHTKTIHNTISFSAPG